MAGSPKVFYEFDSFRIDPGGADPLAERDRYPIDPKGL